MIKGFLSWRRDRLNEDLPAKVAKDYESIKRSEEVEKRLNEIFSKLATLPGANVLMDGPMGIRISLPFERSNEKNRPKTPTEREVEDALNAAGYKLDDYIEGKVTDSYGRTVKMNVALKKIKRDDLIIKVNKDEVREGIKSYVVIFSTVKTDYAQQTTGRGWAAYSCKGIDGPIGKKYLKSEIEDGSFICYLTKRDDIGIKKPTGRVVFHPFHQVGNPKIISYQPDQAYGTIPDNFAEFANSLVRKVQRYNSGKLGVDSSRIYCDFGYQRDVLDPEMEDSVKGISFAKNEKLITKVLVYFGIVDYKINPDMSVDVEGNVDLRNRKLVGLPLQFGKVNGVFLCSENEIKSLEGSPHTVKGFGCGNNKLSSLVGGPKIVTGSYVCINNKMYDLEGAPEEIGGTFMCSGSSLQYLTGHPKKVGGEFDCSGNNIKSFEGVSMVVGEIFNCSDNDPKVTKEQQELARKNIKAESFEF